MTEILCTLITALAGIVVAVLSVYIKRIEDRAKEADERNDRANEVRKRESLLNLRLTYAAVGLSMVCANALMDYKNNGNVELAYQAAAEAKEEYNNLMQELTAHEVGK